MALRNISISVEVINEFRRELNKAYAAEEEYWRLKSRNRWLNFGDRNSRFYHGMVKAKRNHNNINGMFDGSGILHTKDETIAQIAEE